MNSRKEPREIQFNIRVTPKQMEELRRKAFDSNTSIASMVRSVLEKSKLISPTVKLFT